MSEAKQRPGRRRKKVPADALRGKVRAHDPFDLIRWLALSQPDSRKAMAELVQNSMDAGAAHIRVTRIRDRGVPCLKIFDDGEGVIPELDRAEALKYIATHVGHSRKRSLSPQERLALMTQGQYGIGLLGFWSLGERLEMRTAVPGGRPHRLILHRDRPDFLIEKLRGRLPLGECWTEVVVAGLHPEAQSALLGRRVADYLAAELRGQLLSRDVELIVEDRMSRGRAPKEIRVRPPRFLGERLDGIGPLDLPGYPPIRFEIYLAGDSRPDHEQRGLALYASGTLVVESFHDLGQLGLDHPPWTDPRLTGIVDFPSLSVAPGSRRGVSVDPAAGAFAEALGSIEAILSSVLTALDRRRAEELDRSLIRDLQRAFRGLYRQRPSYAMLPVSRPEDVGTAPGDGNAGAAATDGAGESTDHLPAGQDREPSGSARAPAVDLLPPGPLHAVQVKPSPIKVLVLGTREIRVVGVDALGRTVDEAPTFSASVSPDYAGRVEPADADDGRFTVHGGDVPGRAKLRIVARTATNEARGETRIDVVEDLGTSKSAEGIPEPDLVSHPSASWRSRMVDGRWQVNTGHRDYRSIADRSSQKLRYLTTLFAKEVVLRSNQDPRLDKPLEQMAEVTAYADRNLTRARRVHRRTPKKE